MNSLLQLLGTLWGFGYHFRDKVHFCRLRYLAPLVVGRLAGDELVVARLMSAICTTCILHLRALTCWVWALSRSNLQSED